MKRTRLISLGLSGLAVLMMLAGSLAQAATNDSHTEKVLASFQNHIASLDSVAQEKKAEVTTLVERLAKDESPDVLTEALLQLYPSYSKAVESSDNDNVDSAVQLLSPLADADDKFLAADASFYLARTLMNNERFEEAMPRLEQLIGDLAQYTAHKGSAHYFIGVAQAGLLKNDDAIESLMQFLQFNPHAPERLRVSAWRQVQLLQSIEEGKLDDVYQRMDYSRRRLELVETDEVTQIEQDKIVKMLTKMIKEEEKKESSSSAKKSKSKQASKKAPGQKQAQSKPGDGKGKQGGRSSNANGKVVKKSYDESPASPWARLRDRSRDPANNAVKEKLPARYRDIVERYTEAASGGNP